VPWLTRRIRILSGQAQRSRVCMHAIPAKLNQATVSVHFLVSAAVVAAAVALHMRCAEPAAEFVTLSRTACCMYDDNQISIEDNTEIAKSGHRHPLSLDDRPGAISP
jgi:hypothetical protein